MTWFIMLALGFAVGYWAGTGYAFDRKKSAIAALIGFVVAIALYALLK